MLAHEEIILRLKEIERLSQEVRAGLNVNFKICSCCDMKKWENWDHSQLRDSMQAVETRCVKSRGVLERKANVQSAQSER